MEFLQPLQQRIILLEVLAEAQAGIDYDSRTLYSQTHCLLGPLAEFALDQQNDVCGGLQVVPFLRPATHVHQHRAALQFAQSFAHLRIPAESADVVHNLSTGLDRRFRNLGLIGVYRDDSIGFLLLERLDDRNYSL